MSGFGLRPIAKEGAPCHPDYFGGFGGTDKAYVMRMVAYAKHFGLSEAKKTECSRPELWQQVERGVKAEAGS